MTRATAWRPRLDNDINVCRCRESHTVRISVKHYGDAHYRHVYMRPADALRIGLQLAKHALDMGARADKK